MNWRKEPPTVDEVRAQGSGLSMWWSRKEGVIFPPCQFALNKDGEVREYPTGWRAPPDREWAPCSPPDFVNIRSAALALPVEDRHRLRSELAATLPLPACYVPVPALLAHEAGKMTAAQVEELIGLLTKRRPS